MALAYGQASVGHASAVAILAAETTSHNIDEPPIPVTLLNPSAGKTVFIGDAAVTAVNGCAIPSGQSVQLALYADEALYAICGGTDTATLSYLASGR